MAPQGPRQAWQSSEGSFQSNDWVSSNLNIPNANLVFPNFPSGIKPTQLQNVLNEVQV